MIIRVELETRSWNTGGADPDDRWSRDSSDGEVTGVTACVVTGDAELALRGSGTKELEGVGPGGVVYAVVAQYSTGDTFGRDGGQGQLLDFFAGAEKAEGLLAVCEARLRAQKAVEGQHWASGARIKKVVPPLEFEGRDYYANWEGYFECLDWIRVEPVVVGGRVVRPSEW